MFKKLLDSFGLHLYCVNFTLINRIGSYNGMISVICYAENAGRARRRAIKRLNRQNIMFNGEWSIDIELI